MNNFTDVLEFLKKQNDETKLSFYDRLGFNLTIAIRSIWSNAALTDKEKVEAIKTINELSHQIFNWMGRLREGDKTFDDAACFADIRQHAQQDKHAGGEIGEAVMSGYQYLTQHVG